MILATEREKCAHLLRRFALGASEAELDYYLQGGLKGAIDKLLDYESVDEGFSYTLEDVANKKDQVKMPALQGWWILRLVMTRRPLQEKMTLFWHDHFATSASKVAAPLLMYGQNEILRKNATGDFKTLLSEVSKDAAMLYWLDNQFNVKGKPNENFAREVMELFTLGIGNYTEKDIQESARAFTGWTFGRRGRTGKKANLPPKNAAFYMDEEAHDDGTKTVFGRTGNFDGDDIIGLLCDQPRTPRYITEKIWEWFVYPKPSATVLETMASVFKTSGLNIQALLRAIMESQEFYSDRAVRAIYKNPVDFIIPIVRELGFGEVLGRARDIGGEQKVQLGAVHALQLSTKSMGMDLLFPPDVSGWESGPAWITSATIVERIKFADRVFGQAAEGLKGQKGGGNVNLRGQAYTLFESDPSPRGLVEKLLSVYDAPLKSDKKPELVSAATKALGGAQLGPQNANATAAAVSRLIFGSPEFQFA